MWFPSIFRSWPEASEAKTVSDVTAECHGKLENLMLSFDGPEEVDSIHIVESEILFEDPWKMHENNEHHAEFPCEATKNDFTETPKNYSYLWIEENEAAAPRVETLESPEIYSPESMTLNWDLV